MNKYINDWFISIIMYLIAVISRTLLKTTEIIIRIIVLFSFDIFKEKLIRRMRSIFSNVDEFILATVGSELERVYFFPFTDLLSSDSSIRSIIMSLLISYKFRKFHLLIWLSTRKNKLIYLSNEFIVISLFLCNCILKLL